MIHSNRSAFHFNKGFTLIEVMITLSVLGILLSIATPSMRSFIEASRMSTVTNEVAGDLFYIRSESLKRRINVYLCPKKSPSLEVCETSASDANYANGWLMYADCNNNGTYDTTMTCDLDGDGTTDRYELLKVHDSLVNDITIKTSSTFQRRIGYKMSGRSSSAGNFCITIASKRSKKIIIAATGRVRIIDIEQCD
jgi:type IV fimbrial biogenesis protein FimT